jgi:flagellar biosynthesis/type III secretory pathway chaperone
MTLSDGLDRQIATMETLRTCLEEEHQALQSRDPEQLLSVTERKTACLSDAGKISRLCQELEANEAAQTPTTSGRAISRQRDQLDTLTRMCRDLNIANGSLIRRQKTRVEKTLQIMRGEPEHADVYGPSGVAASRNSTRRILTSI